MPYPDKDNKNKIADKAKPDDPSCPAVTVDFSKNIAKDIAQGAQTLASLQNDESIDELITGFNEQEIEDLIGGSAGLDNKEPNDTENKCPECGFILNA